MAKPTKAYVCAECSASFSKWRGQCPACDSWNTISDEPIEVIEDRQVRAMGYSGETSEVQMLSEVDLKSEPRISTEISEFDRVLGGGLVRGSCVLLGGHPGAGKSTLLLQVADNLGVGNDVLYVTGEESPAQIADRARRLGLKANIKLLAETNVEKICQTAEKHQPRILIIDSIQVMLLSDVRSAPGSVSQVREAAAYLTRFAKQTGTILLLVGHVTKDGSLAGPKTLEHIIDASLLLEGSTDSKYRTLRAQKNRFGTVNELGVFVMLEKGLREVRNPSAIFLSRPEGVISGSVVTALWEGTRPLLVELQTLVDPSSLEIPRRVVVGVEGNRLAMLIAVLNKHARIQIAGSDIFVNVVGGVKATEPGSDLALAAALNSSFREKPVPPDLLVFGEVGLSGEIRPVSYGAERIAEAVKHGFTRALVPSKNVPKKSIPDIEVIGVESIRSMREFMERI
jgi:DNA repair protein RadA/Sms